MTDAHLWEEGSKLRQGVGYLEQPPCLAGLSKSGQTPGSCKWALEHREQHFIAGASFGDLHTAPEGSLKVNRENGQKAEMGSAGAQAGAGMFTAFLQVWLWLTQKKRSALAVQALNLFVDIKSCFLMQVNEFWHDQPSKHNHVSDTSQSLVLNEQEAAL